MGKHTSTWIVVSCIVALIIGGSLTYWLTPEKVRTEIKVKEVPVETIKEVPIEVIKEVPIKEDLKQKVTEKLIADLKENSDYRECSGDVYRASEVAVYKVYDGYDIVNDDRGDLSIENIEIRLNFDAGECFKTITCELNSDEQLNCA